MTCSLSDNGRIDGVNIPCRDKNSNDIAGGGGSNPLLLLLHFIYTLTLTIMLTAPISNIN